MVSLRDIIGNNIRKVRQDREWSQEELAHQAEISTSHLGKIERGVQNLTIDTLDRVACALGVSAELLLKADAPPDPNTQALLEQFRQMPMQLSYSSFPHVKNDPDLGEYLTFGVVAYYVQSGQPLQQAYCDICIRQKAVERFTKVLNALQLPPQHFEDAVEDFCLNDYSL